MKVELGARNCLYPMLTTIVGANVKGKPNYTAIAHIGIMDFSSISVSSHRAHYTNIGIKENRTFSVNIPSLALVRETDYCGLVSGNSVDKSTVFESFYGQLGTAPLIKACPINLECKLTRVLEFPQHEVFIGEIVETYCDESCLKDGQIDLSRVQPILFAMFDKNYWRLGERFVRAWQIGKQLKSDQ